MRDVVKAVRGRFVFSTGGKYVDNHRCEEEGTRVASDVGE